MRLRELTMVLPCRGLARHMSANQKWKSRNEERQLSIFIRKNHICKSSDNCPVDIREKVSETEHTNNID